MPPASRPRTAAAEDGFTLVELLISAVLMMVVLTASLAVLKAIEDGQREVSSRSEELTQATVGTERLTREIRQASAVLTPATVALNSVVTSPTLALKTRVLTDNALKETTVEYTSAGGTLTRTAGGVSTVVLRDLASDSVFTVRNTSGVVNYVGFDLRVTSRGRTITLADGVDMRNL